MIEAEVIKGYHPYELVRKLKESGLMGDGLSDPSNDKSPGSDFLRLITHSYAESRERFFATADEDQLNDALTEVADTCVPVNEYDRWGVVIDLSLYDVDLDTGGPHTWEQAHQMITAAVDETARTVLRLLISEDEEAVFDGAMGDGDE